MKNSVKLTVDISPSVDESEVIIRAKEETALVSKIVSLVQQYNRQDRTPITVYHSSNRNMVEQLDIIRVYTQERKLVIWTRDGAYYVKSTLRELEETLDEEWFVRISRYEIINLNWVSDFDLTFRGTIKVVFEDGSSAWVARRYVSAVEQRLESALEKGGSGNE